MRCGCGGLITRLMLPPPPPPTCAAGDGNCRRALGVLQDARGGGACVPALGRSGLAPKPRDSRDGFRGESVGQKALTLEALQSPQHGVMGLRDSLSLGGGMPRAAQYSPAMSSVSTVDLDSVPSLPKRALPEGYRQAPLVNNFMGGLGDDAFGLVVSRRLQVAKRQ